MDLASDAPKMARDIAAIRIAYTLGVWSESDTQAKLIQSEKYAVDQGNLRTYVGASCGLTFHDLMQTLRLLKCLIPLRPSQAKRRWKQHKTLHL